MKFLNKFLRNPKKSSLKIGTYRYDGIDELKGHRFHLRVDNEGKGVLLVDASKLIFLNGTALDYVRCLLENRTDNETIKYMKRIYKKLNKETAKKHYHMIKAQIKDYLKGNINVIETVGTEKSSIGADDLPSPYRMDIALTYACQNDCSHCYNEVSRKKATDRKELSLDDWVKVIEKLWGIGIPHIVFTGGEPMLSPYLKQLIAKSEDFGQVTGLITNGRKLGENGYLKELVRVGLDHVQITILSHNESLHDALVGSKGAWKETVEGIKVALCEDLYVSTNTTIMKANVGETEETMRFLISLGVKNIAFNSIIRSGKGESAEGIDYEQLAMVLTKLSFIAKEKNIKLIWYSPTPYCEFNPVNYGFGIKQCTACSINMAIEPDGTVIPCQSYYEPLGNILTDPWDKIWEHKLCKELRERKYMVEKCKDCKLSLVCGGGCPLSIKHSYYTCFDRHSSI